VDHPGDVDHHHVVHHGSLAALGSSQGEPAALAALPLQSLSLGSWDTDNDIGLSGLLPLVGTDCGCQSEHVEVADLGPFPPSGPGEPTIPRAPGVSQAQECGPAPAGSGAGSGMAVAQTVLAPPLESQAPTLGAQATSIAMPVTTDCRVPRSEWNLERRGKERAVAGTVLGQGTFGTAVTFQHNRTLVVKKMVNTLIQPVVVTPRAAADGPPRTTPAEAAPAAPAGPPAIHVGHVGAPDTGAGVTKGEEAVREHLPGLGPAAAHQLAGPALSSCPPATAPRQRVVIGIPTGAPAVHLVPPAQALPTAALCRPTRRAVRFQQLGAQRPSPSRPLGASTSKSPSVVIAPGAASSLEKEVQVYTYEGLASHPNVVRYLGKGGGHLEFHILLDYCAGVCLGPELPACMEIAKRVSSSTHAPRCWALFWVALLQVPSMSYFKPTGSN
jgi:hypothetical protein